MEQSLTNLLDNTCKYLEPGRVGLMSIIAEQNKDAVIGQWPGECADDIDKVFAIFRRAGQQDTPGEGMGLDFVKAMVRRHGGKVWCESVLE